MNQKGKEKKIAFCAQVINYFNHSVIHFINYFTSRIWKSCVGLKTLKKQQMIYNNTVNVKGIHNPSDGIILDLIECIYQRYFERDFIESEPVKHTCEILNSYVRNQGINNIILVGHSQGCIILDLAIKRIHRDMIDKSKMNIFKIYTFANPVLPSEFFKDVTNINYNNVEHFYNREDFVAKLGIANTNEHENQGYLSNIFCSKPCERDENGNRIIEDKKGHLFGAHYSLRKSDYIDGNNSNFLID